MLSSFPIAITDLETTGTDPSSHEIIELGLIVVDQASFRILDSLELKVRPEHPETASESALVLNGYNAADWANAVSLEDAVRAFAEKTSSAIFCSHNVTFDWAFMYEAFRKTKIENRLDYHRLDLFTMAWTLLRGSDINEFSLRHVGKFLGLGEEPFPHRAINGAKLAYEVFKTLVALDPAKRSARRRIVGQVSQCATVK